MYTLPLEFVHGRPIPREAVELGGGKSMADQHVTYHYRNHITVDAAGKRKGQLRWAD